MSFIWKRPEGRLKSPEQCAREILEVALEMGLDEFAAVLETMCVAQESDFWCPWNAKDPSSHNYPFDSESNDGRSVGYQQAQNGRAGDTLPAGDSDNWWGSMADRMDLKTMARRFFERLEGSYRTAINDPSLASNRFISNVQRPRPDLRGAYAQHWDRAWQLVHAANQPVPQPQPAPGDPMRPDFNEINKIGIENGSHSSIRSQLPKNWFLHTQQGNGNAEDLFNFLMSTSGEGAVSYHYAIAEDRNDHGVTVVDVCDTDRYSWSVLNANVFSINACFAGSFAEQTRDEWLANYRNAIRVAAYLAVQDCKKYPTIAAVVIPPPYVNHGSGISDHRFVTKALGIGSHTDVGGPMGLPWNGFPWDVLAADVQSFLVPVVVGPDTPPPVVDNTPLFSYPSTDEMTKQLWEQAFGPQAKGWEALFGKTTDGKRGKFTVEAISDLHKGLPQ